MGLLHDTLYETLTDGLAERALAAIVSPAVEMLQGNTAPGLAAQLDAATPDAAIQAALLNYCDGVDRQVLAPNLYTYYTQILRIASWDALIKRIAAYVTSVDGGNYATLGAYLAAVGAQTHPLAGELMRMSLGEQVFGASLPMCPKMQIQAFEHVYTVTGAGVVVDVTDEASDVAAADVDFFNEAGAMLVFQSRSRFTTILSALSSLSEADEDITARYWDGTSWVTVENLVDRTVGMTEDGGITSYDMPSGWVPSNALPDTTLLPDQAELYTLILTHPVHASGAGPVATWLMMIPEAISNAAGALFGVDQPPLAICRITELSAVVVTVLQAPSTRFAYPGTANSALKLRAITAIDEDVTFTLGYVDQGGVNGVKQQSAWSSIDPGDTKTLALDTGDTAIQSIRSAACAITTAATSGIFVIEVADYARAINAK